MASSSVRGQHLSACRVPRSGTPGRALLAGGKIWYSKSCCERSGPPHGKTWSTKSWHPAMNLARRVTNSRRRFGNRGRGLGKWCRREKFVGWASPTIEWWAVPTLPATSRRTLRRACRFRGRPTSSNTSSGLGLCDHSVLAVDPACSRATTRGRRRL